MWTRITPLIAAIAGLTTHAGAADLDQTVAIDSARFDGAYIGLEGGYALSESEAKLNRYTGALIQLDLSNGLFPTSIGERMGKGGVTGVAGYNRQIGNMVFGVEADATFQDHENTHSFSRIDPNPAFLNTPTNTTYKTSIKKFGTLRGRIGHTVGNTLVYGTAGVAVGEIENAFSLELPLVGYAKNTWERNETKYGYAVGLGVEHKLTSNLSLRLSGQYIGFKSSTITASDPPVFGDNSITYKFKNDLSVVRAGLAYQF